MLFECQLNIPLARLFSNHNLTMKRPAADPPGVEPLPVRRHYEPQQLASSPVFRPRPRPSRVSDDEEIYSPAQTVPKVDIPKPRSTWSFIFGGL